MTVKNSEQKYGLGRRKSAKARVFLKSGSGNIVVNRKPFDTYFGRKSLQKIVRQPLALLKQEEAYDILVTVKGGGPAGQAGAVRLGIARALEGFDAENRPALKAEGFLTRDSRAVERKKYGRHKARRRPQFSKR